MRNDKANPLGSIDFENEIKHKIMPSIDMLEKLLGNYRDKRILSYGCGAAAEPGMDWPYFEQEIAKRGSNCLWP